nr:PREDICTED: UPF0329 protein ECU05_1680/ECU11_0050-like [Austrofundulus limnaeus]
MKVYDHLDTCCSDYVKENKQAGLRQTLREGGNNQEHRLYNRKRKPAGDFLCELEASVRQEIRAPLQNLDLWRFPEFNNKMVMELEKKKEEKMRRDKAKSKQIERKEEERREGAERVREEKRREEKRREEKRREEKRREEDKEHKEMKENVRGWSGPQHQLLQVDAAQHCPLLDRN